MGLSVGGRGVDMGGWGRVSWVMGLEMRRVAEPIDTRVRLYGTYGRTRRSFHLPAVKVSVWTCRHSSGSPRTCD